MMSPRRVAALVLKLTVCLPWMAVTSAAEMGYRLVSIDTGSATGVYYFAGGVMCDFINAGRWHHGIRCLAHKSNGSIDNLKAVRRGAATFGIVQSDWHLHAVRGTSVFEGSGPDTNLRSVFSLYPEPFTVIARPDFGITRFADLKGKRVDIGPPGSGGRATMEVVIQVMGWSKADLGYVSEREISALPRALCTGEIDAAVFIIAHPNLAVEDMVNTCDARLVPVGGSVIERVVEQNAYYFAWDIPPGTYAGQKASTPTFALAATLVASSRTSPRVVHEVVRSIFDNLGALRDAHPAFAELDRQRMATDGLTAPLHEGARRYFVQQGILSGQGPAQRRDADP